MLKHKDKPKKIEKIANIKVALKSIPLILSNDSFRSNSFQQEEIKSARVIAALRAKEECFD